jgi:hypothetical protein
MGADWEPARRGTPVGPLLISRDSALFPPRRSRVAGAGEPCTPIVDAGIHAVRVVASVVPTRRALAIALTEALKADG